MVLAEGGDFGRGGGDGGGVGGVSVGGAPDLGEESADLGHFRFLHATGGGGRDTEADAAPFHGVGGVAGHRVFVAGEVGVFDQLFRLVAAEVGGADIDQHEVVVGAAGEDGEPFALEGGGEGTAVFDDLGGVAFEFRLERFTEANRFGGDDVEMDAPLGAGEDGAVELLFPLGVAGEDDAATGAA